MNLQEFGEATAFERWTLESLVPLPPNHARGGQLDADAGHVTICLEEAVAVVEVRAGGRKIVTPELRPLAFGAAWKVLDLLLELAYSNAGFSPGGSGHWSIKKKVELADQGAGEAVPLSQDVPLWATLLKTYAGTSEIRHSLVHRKATVARDGNLCGVDRLGGSLEPMSGAQQEAFCRAVQRAADATIVGAVTRRERSDLAWQLDQLRQHHRQSDLGGVRHHAPLLVTTSPSLEQGQVSVDIPALLRKARSTWREGRSFDLEVRLPDGRRVLGELESAPMREVTFDPAQPPEWLAIVEDGPLPA